MRILKLASWYPRFPGDPTGRFILEQAEALRSIGHDVLVVDCSHFSRMIPRILQNKFRELSIYRILKKAKWQPEVIHAHVAYPAGEIALRAARKLKVPVVLTEHTGPLSLLERYYKSKEDFYSQFEKYNKVIAVSGYLANQITSQNSKAKVEIVGNIVRDEFFESPITDHTPNEYPTGAFIGSLTIAKGFHTLLETLTLLEKDKFQVKIKILGKGPLEAQGRQLVDQFSFVHLEFVKASKTTVLEVLQKSDFLILPSQVETFSLVAAEAIALGKPVFGLECGGPEDFVSENRGLLVPRHQSKHLSEDLKNFLQNENWFNGKESMAEERREFIRNRYSKTEIANQISKILAGSSRECSR